jgi:hypothetical protein
MLRLEKRRGSMNFSLMYLVLEVIDLKRRRMGLVGSFPKLQNINHGNKKYQVQETTK